LTRPLIAAILALVLLLVPAGAGALTTPLPQTTATPTVPATPRGLGSPNMDIPNYLYDGYWWRDETFVPGYISVETWFTPAPISIRGRAVYYAPGVMEATANVRGMSLDGYVDGVSLMSPADIGRKVWIKRAGGWEGPFLVVDCARRGDMWPIIVGRQEVVEVGFKTAVAWGMARSMGGAGWKAIRWSTDQVQVYIASKPPPIAVNPADYSEWFLERATYVGRSQDIADHIVVTRQKGLSGSACWKWHTGIIYCTENDRSAPWVRPDDYLPPWRWPTKTLTATPTATATRKPTPTKPPATPDWRHDR